MINRSTIMEILEENKKIKKYLKDVKDFDLVVKILTPKDLQILTTEYPDLINWDFEHQTKEGIFCITIAKPDEKKLNYSNINKIKLYISKKNKRILKILEN